MAQGSSASISSRSNSFLTKFALPNNLSAANAAELLGFCLFQLQPRWKLALPPNLKPRFTLGVKDTRTGIENTFSVL